MKNINTVNKKYLVGGIILTIIIATTLLLNGCTKRMSDNEMIECKKYEDELPDNLLAVDYYVKEMVDNSNNVFGHRPILSNKRWIDMYAKDINKISLEKLELYHENLKKYKDVEDDNFQNIKYSYLLSKRKLAYCKEIISLCEDEDVSSEDTLKIQKIGVLSNIIANENDEDPFAHSEKLIKLQTQLDEKYEIDSNELYLLQETINE